MSDAPEKRKARTTHKPPTRKHPFGTKARASDGVPVGLEDRQKEAIVMGFEPKDIADKDRKEWPKELLEGWERALKAATVNQPSADDLKAKEAPSDEAKARKKEANAKRTATYKATLKAIETAEAN